MTVRSVQQIRWRPEWNSENKTAKATQPNLAHCSSYTSTHGWFWTVCNWRRSLCWHPDLVPPPRQQLIHKRCVYIACFATTLVYTNRSLATLLLLLFCLPAAANVYIVVSQDVVIVVQLLYLKCMHVLVETSIYTHMYVACYSHQGIST